VTCRLFWSMELACVKLFQRYCRETARGCVSIRLALCHSSGQQWSTRASQGTSRVGNRTDFLNVAVRSLQFTYSAFTCEIWRVPLDVFPSCHNEMQENPRALLYSCYYYYYISTANGSLPGSSGTTIRHNTQIHISHNAQTKHGTQSYTNNKGHIIHNEYKHTDTQKQSCPCNRLRRPKGL
jgi:hypothetical protein